MEWKAWRLRSSELKVVHMGSWQAPGQMLLVERSLESKMLELPNCVAPRPPGELCVQSYFNLTFTASLPAVQDD